MLHWRTGWKSNVRLLELICVGIVFIGFCEQKRVGRLKKLLIDPYAAGTTNEDETKLPPLVLVRVTV